MWNQDAATHLYSSSVTIWEVYFLALVITKGDILYQQKDKSHYQVSTNCLMFSSEALQFDKLLLDLNFSFSYPSILLKSKIKISYGMMFFICNLKRAEWHLLEGPI